MCGLTGRVELAMAAATGPALITGATGFIGRRLLSPGDRALVRRPAGFAGEVVGDLLDGAALARACEGVEAVFHCAGVAEVGAHADTLWRVNFEGTRRLLDAAGRAGVQRFVFFSSVKALAEPGEACADEDWPGEPATPYGRAKRAAEAAVLEAGAKYGMHAVNLRLAPVYGRGGKGNLERLARGLRAGWFPRLKIISNRCSIVHVADVVAAARIAAQRPEANGRTYIVADPRPYSTWELCEAILTVPPAPTWGWTLSARALQLAGRWHPRLAEITGRLMGSACYSPARIERELGFRARVGLAEGLREMLA